MTLEHLLSELLVALGTALDGVDLESVRVGVHVMVLGEEIRHGVEGKDDAANHANNNLLVWDLGSGNVGEVLRNVVGHLRSGGGGTVFVLNHTIMELRRHSNNHVVEVWVEVSSLGNVKTERWVVVVTSQQVV